MSDLEWEIKRFEATERRSVPGGRWERLEEHVFAFLPDNGASPWRGDKRYALGFMGLTHGNETAGAAVLGGILDALEAGFLDPPLPLLFILGNARAARQGERFLETDLNRSFAVTTPASVEQLRARRLEPFLAETAAFVDFHQTKVGSAEPFFIFPYTSSGLKFARSLAPERPVVTHWGKPFSADGRCTDEYVISQGGSGITLELGQNGLSPYQVGVGTLAGLWALRTVAYETVHGQPLERSRPPGGERLYTWAGTVPWPRTGLVSLDPGWVNFAPVAKGQRLGEADGQEIRATAEGFVLFPKYVPAEIQKAGACPAELCRIVRPASPQELPYAE